MDIKSLEDLPNEIIIQNIIVHLSSKDVLSFGPFAKQYGYVPTWHPMMLLDDILMYGREL